MSTNSHYSISGLSALYLQTLYCDGPPTEIYQTIHWKK